MHASVDSSPPAPVSLHLCPLPFAVARVDREFPAGLTIAEMMLACGLDPMAVVAARVFIDDLEIPRPNWRLVRPKPGRIVSIRVLPTGGGGGKSPLRTILMIAVIAAASWAAGAFGPALGAALFGETTTAGIVGLGATVGTAASSALGSALVGAAVTMVGSLAVNAIAPPPRPRLSDFSGRGLTERTSPSLSLTGIQNRASLYGPIPRVYGRCRVYPAIGAAQWTETVGDDVYLRCLFDLGYGPLALSDLRIGTTPLSAFESVEVEIREGLLSDTPITLYTNTIHEDGYSIELRQDAGPRTIESRDLADEITADLSFNGLTAGVDAGGNLNARTVEIKVEYRLAGSGGAYTLHSILPVTGATLQTLRHPVRIVPPVRGRYEVRFTRLTANANSASAPDLSYLTALRTITYTPPTNFTGHALVALRIKASNQLNGLVQTFNLIAQAKLVTWDGAALTAPVATRNPIWAALDVLIGAANKRPQALSAIDLPSFRAAALACDAPDQNGEEKYRFDAVYDARTTVAEAVRDILATCRAFMTLRDGKWSVVRDAPQSVPVNMFGSRNSWGFHGSRVFVRLPHALKCRFINPDKDDGQDEVTVYADGHDAASATLFETIEMFGVRRASQAWREGRYHLAVAQLRPDTYEINADIEALVCSRGDLVRVQHDVVRWGLGGGRIKSLTVDGSSNVTSVTLDEVFTLEAGKAYGLRIRRDEGQQVYAGVQGVGVATETQTLTFNAPIPASSAPEPGDLAFFGEANKETVELIVTGIRRRGMNAVLTLVDAAPAVHTADTGPIPAFDPQSTFPSQGVNLDPPAPLVTEVRSDEVAMVEQPGGTLVVAIRVTLEARAGVAVAIDHLEVQYRRVGSGDDWRRQSFAGRPFVATLVNVEEGATYDLRLRHVTASGRASDWTAISNHLVVGKSSAPPDVPALSLSGGLLMWSYPEPPRDLAGFRVMWNAGDNRNRAAALPAHPGLIAAPPFDTAVLPGGTVTIFVVALDTSGNESADAAVLVKDLGGPASSNLVETIDLETLGFPGTITGGALIGDDLKANSLARLWSNDAALLWSTDSAPLWAAAGYDTLVYECEIAIAALWAPADIFLELETSGASPSIEYRRSDARLWTNDAAPLWSSDSALLWGNASAWQPWPGRLNVGREPIGFRVTMPSGPAQGVILAFRVVVDVDDVREQLLDLMLPATASRIAPSKTYRAIKTVRFDLLDDGGAAVNVRILDRDPVLGPLVQPIDAALAGTTATVNAMIEGY